MPGSGYTAFCRAKEKLPLSKKKATTYTISIVDDTLKVISALANREDKSIRELGSELAIPKSTLYRILRTLEAKDFVRQGENSEKYSLGLKFFEFGMMLKEKFDIKNLAYPHILDLRNRTKETIQLAIVDRQEILILDTVEGTHDLRVFSRAGRRLPLTYGNFGKVFLSDYTDDEVGAMLRKYPLKRYGANSVMDNQVFVEHVKEVREKRISVGIDDPIDGAFAIAVPIMSRESKTVAAISMAGAKTQANITRLEHFKEELMETARLVSRDLGLSS
jgi:DNA-binding IclR family transcriptional regulator